MILSENPNIGTRITLTWYEVELAKLVGRLRRENSRKRKNQRGLEDEEDALLAMDIEGAAGEIAVARAINRYWHGSVNAPKSAPDIGASIQVRTTKHENGSLILVDRDLDDHVYFLAIGEMPNYRIAGYIVGTDGKKKEYIRAPAGRPPAYFVPQNKLSQIGA